MAGAGRFPSERPARVARSAQATSWQNKLDPKPPYPRRRTAAFVLIQAAVLQEEAAGGRHGALRKIHLGVQNHFFTTRGLRRELAEGGRYEVGSLKSEHAHHFGVVAVIADCPAFPRSVPSASMTGEAS